MIHPDGLLLDAHRGGGAHAHFVEQHDPALLHASRPYITLHTSRIILEAVRIAKVVKARRVEVHGGRAATLLSDGRVLTWQREPDAPDGVNDAGRRRIPIRMAP